MGAEKAIRSQIHVLRLIRESDGSIRYALRIRGAEKELHFASLEALSEHLRSLEAQLKRPMEGLR
jgi:hypothetical protein